jgi:hypothetical protein
LIMGVIQGNNIKVRGIADGEQHIEPLQNGVMDVTRSLAWSGDHYTYEITFTQPNYSVAIGGYTPPIAPYYGYTDGSSGGGGGGGGTGVDVPNFPDGTLDMQQYMINKRGAFATDAEFIDWFLGSIYYHQGYSPRGIYDPQRAWYFIWIERGYY